MSFFFLLLFVVVTFATYIAIRRSWAPTLTLAVAGTVANIVCFAMYGITENQAIGQALVSGILFGGVFSIIAVIIAIYFKSGRPEPEAPSESD